MESNLENWVRMVELEANGEFECVSFSCQSLYYFGKVCIVHVLNRAANH